MDILSGMRNAISSAWSYVVNLITFCPRPKPSYTISPGNQKESLRLQLDVKRCGDGAVAWQDWFETYVTPSASGSRIACIYIHLYDNPDVVLLASHSNGSDIGDNLNDYINMAVILECNILAYDYAGYGGSSGEPSEAEVYENATAAWNLLTKKLRILPHEIVIYGHSIGTVSIDLATRVKSAGVILNAPLMSAYRTQIPVLPWTLPGDKFSSIDKIGMVTTPTLIIQGREDEQFSSRHAATLANECPAAVAPLWLDDAGHMNCQRQEAFWPRTKKFVREETWQPWKAEKKRVKRQRRHTI